MNAKDTPAAEVEIAEALVRGLVADQLADLVPDLHALALVEVGAGWDNVIFRLGARFAVRLPRRAVAAELMVHEQRWLPVLAPSLPLPISVPIGLGRPGRGYPWVWSMNPWLDGEPASVAQFADPGDAAIELARFLVALHRPAPPDAPANPVRGVPLAHRSEQFHEQVDRMAAVIDAPAVRSCWADLVATPPWPGPPWWLHGDLRAGNLLVRDGRLAAVIDFGDITGGDPATDLSVAWMIFDPSVRAVFRDAVGADTDTWRRARGWALALGVTYVATSANDPVLAREGRAVIEAVLTDPR